MIPAILTGDDRGDLLVWVSQSAKPKKRAADCSGKILQPGPFAGNIHIDVPGLQ